MTLCLGMEKGFAETVIGQRGCIYLSREMYSSLLQSVALVSRLNDIYRKLFYSQRCDRVCSLLPQIFVRSWADAVYRRQSTG